PPVYGLKLKTIRCTDRDGNPVEIPNQSSVEIRFITKNGLKVKGYFRSISIKNNAITIHPSVYFPAMTETVMIRDLIRIEIQNSKKGLNSNRSPAFTAPY